MMTQQVRVCSYTWWAWVVVTAAILAAQADTQEAISQQVGLVAQLKHIVSELSSRRPAAQKTMLLQAMLAETGAPGWHNFHEVRVACGPPGLLGSAQEKLEQVFCKGPGRHGRGARFLWLIIAIAGHKQGDYPLRL